MSKKIHAPTSAQVFSMVATAGDPSQDMRTMTSGALMLRGPSRTVHTIPATLGTATQTSVAVTSAAIDPAQGEAAAQAIGVYAMWAIVSGPSGIPLKANNNPLLFSVVKDWENTK